jgi:TolB protein
MNADGTRVEQLFPEAAMAPRWSPDGSEISLFCCDDGMAAHIIHVETGDFRTLPPPDRDIETFCGLWSPDGTRLACESFGVDDPSLNGIYSIDAEEGGDLQRITSAPDMNDQPGDYSPDGTRLVFQRWNMEGPIAIFITNLDGTGLERLTPPEMVLDESGHSGRWSPTGGEILFVAHTAEGEHKAIWVVSADGGTPQQLPISPACGGPFEPGNFGCYSPDWSPDGEHIIFTRSDGRGESLYMVNADGSGLVQVTDGEDDAAHWGPSSSRT